jgi:hypothetical protein
LIEVLRHVKSELTSQHVGTKASNWMCGTYRIGPAERLRKGKKEFARRTTTSLTVPLWAQNVLGIRQRT